MRMTESRCRLFGIIILALFGGTLMFTILSGGIGSLGVLGWIKIALILALGALMIRAKKDNAAFIAILAFCVADIIMNFISGFSIWAIVGIIAPIGLAVLAVLNFKMPDKAEAVNKLWFIIPIAVAIPYIVLIIQYASYMGPMGLLMELFSLFLYTVLYFAFARWMAFKLVDNGFDQRENSKAYFKDLLDRGVITQSEYDEKMSKLN